MIRATAPRSDHQYLIRRSIDDDDYQVRLYHAWYRHVTLAMLAHAFLAVCAHKHASKKEPERADPVDREPQDQQ
jgi:SRSO17 transposase